uniref:Sodium/hydrogen exchanger n=1 Tax=Rodentolepis nana TaxID=102285 RepID=A0A0R3TC21_RODNA
LALLVAWLPEEVAQFISFNLMVSIVLILRVINYVIKSAFTSAIPESLIAIFAGSIIGSLMRNTEIRMSYFWEFTPTLFFMILLPFCIIDAAYSLYNRTFADCVVAIISYAVFATVLNMILIGTLLIIAEQIGFFKAEGFKFGPQVLMFYAATIVAVDPVAVLNVFYEIGVDPNLYYLVLGESLLNDAVTVALYKIVNEFLDSREVTIRDVLIGIAAFFTINAGGILVGIILGVLSCILTRIPTRLEVVFLFIGNYSAYLLGDALGWSGLVCLITCGMVQSSYAFHNLSSEDAVTCRRMAHMLADICETMTFLLIGMKMTSNELYWHTSFILSQLIVCLVVRSVVVFGMTWCLNKYDMNYSRITVTEQFILAYGGLRGAVALSLVYLGDTENIDQGQHGVHKILITATLFTILFTVGFMGPTMRPLARLLRVKLAAKQEISLMKELNERIIDEVNSGLEVITGHMGWNRARDWFLKVNEKYIRKVLQNDPQFRNQKIVKVYQDMALVLHQASLNPKKAHVLLEELPVNVRTAYRAQELEDMTETYHQLKMATTRSPVRKFYDYHSLFTVKLQQFWGCVSEPQNSQANRKATAHGNRLLPWVKNVESSSQNPDRETKSEEGTQSKEGPNTSGNQGSPQSVNKMERKSEHD